MARVHLEGVAADYISDDSRLRWQRSPSTKMETSLLPSDFADTSASRLALLTTCTADKSRAPGRLPAGQRYRGWRIVLAQQRAAQEGLPLLFLSGVYGIVSARHPLPWYDHALQPAEVEGLISPTAAQLEALGVEALTALLLPSSTPGWAPYHALLRAACDRAAVRCRVELLTPPRPLD